MKNILFIIAFILLWGQMLGQIVPCNWTDSQRIVVQIESPQVWCMEKDSVMQISWMSEMEFPFQLFRYRFGKNQEWHIRDIYFDTAVVFRTDELVGVDAIEWNLIMGCDNKFANDIVAEGEVSVLRSCRYGCIVRNGVIWHHPMW